MQPHIPVHGNQEAWRDGEREFYPGRSAVKKKAMDVPKAEQQVSQTHSVVRELIANVRLASIRAGEE